MADRPQIAIAVYHAMEEKEEEFFSLIRAHWPVLFRRGLVTPMRPKVAQSATTPGVFIETFEWKSPAAVDRAHRDPEVQRIWNAMAAIWQKPSATLARLPECQSQFAHFAMLDIRMPLSEQPELKKGKGGKKAAKKAAKKASKKAAKKAEPAAKKAAKKAPAKKAAKKKAAKKAPAKKASKKKAPAKKAAKKKTAKKSARKSSKKKKK